MNFNKLLTLGNAEHAIAYYASVKRGGDDVATFLALEPAQIAADIREWTETRAAAYLFATRNADSLSAAVPIVHDLLEELDAGRRPYIVLSTALKATRVNGI